MPGELARMASILRQNGVSMAYFGHAHWRNGRQVFTIVGLLVNLYSVYITLVYITLSPWRPFGNLSLLVKYSNAMFILCLNSLPWNNLMDIVDCIFHFHMSTTWISPERDKILRNRERLPYSFRTHQNWSSLFIRIDVEKHVYIRLEIRV